MTTNQTVALVTGANRGLGRRFAEQLLARGAKVYAGARRPETVDLPGAIPVQLDVTDPESIARAAAVAGDVNLLINNGGNLITGELVDADADDLRSQMETHYFGSLAVTGAFVPVIERNGGGSILNVLSVLSWLHVPGFGGYSAAKAAAWAMTNVLRQELAPKGIHVAALHVGYMDTDMAATVPPEQKSDPAAIAALTLDALAAGEAEIIADDFTREHKANLSSPVGVPA